MPGVLPDAPGAVEEPPAQPLPCSTPSIQRDHFPTLPHKPDREVAVLLHAIERLELSAQSGDADGMAAEVEGVLQGSLAQMWRPAAILGLRPAARAAACALAERVAAALTALLHDSALDRDRRARLLTAGRARASRTALMLSGGGALGNYHIGVLQVLRQHDLLPAVISGSSAGAVVAAIVGTHPPAELDDRLRPDALANRAGRSADKQLRSGAVVDRIGELVPDLTFAEALAVSGRAIAISVSPRDRSQKPLLLSAAATPDVLVRSAVEASCAIPMLYDSVILRQRSAHGAVTDYLGGQRWVDGSVTADLPTAALRQQFGVDQFIASQVNPVVLPFLDRGLARPGRWSKIRELASDAAKLSVEAGIATVRPLARPFGLTFVLDIWRAVIRQRYVADLTIVPRRRIHGPREVLSSPSASQIAAYIAEGSRAAAAMVPAIAAATAIERALEDGGGPQFSC
jgi:NTE family protein